jgi:hypothetical protein
VPHTYLWSPDRTTRTRHDSELEPLETPKATLLITGGSRLPYCWVRVLAVVQLIKAFHIRESLIDLTVHCTVCIASSSNCDNFNRTDDALGSHYGMSRREVLVRYVQVALRTHAYNF